LFDDVVDDCQRFSTHLNPDRPRHGGSPRFQSWTGTIETPNILSSIVGHQYKHTKEIVDMRLLISAFFMCATIGTAITSQQNSASTIQADVNVSIAAAEEDTPSDVIPMSECPGSRPCCEFNDDGTCNLKMICFGTIWVCP
jgi:hypothetical protein